jgi:parvulin-like peptidyl-prolyl isomerase
MSMLNPVYSFRSVLDLNAIFGIGFTDRLDSRAVNNWQGPVRSGPGYHLVRVSAVHPAEISPYSAVQERVLSDVRESQRRNAGANYIDALMRQYRIIREDE